jgi:hypothetical protein
MAYNEVMKCLAVDTTKSKSTQKDERIHGGLLLLNELLRVSDAEFEVIEIDFSRILLSLKSLE